VSWQGEGPDVPGSGQPSGTGTSATAPGPGRIAAIEATRERALRQQRAGGGDGTGGGIT
jgi:hypothetical protein